MRRRTLTLTESQRSELVTLRDHSPRAYLRERAAALLKIAAGESPHAVARHGLLNARDPDTVYGWLTAYEAAGTAALSHQARGHRGFSPSGGGRTRGDRPANA